jgi:GT2 family glycosyltransferase
MDEHREAGASGCRLVFPNGDHQVGDAGFRPTLGSVSNYALFLSKISPSFKGVYLNHAPRGPCEVDWVCGADLLVKRSIIDDVGSMDEDIFIYADDVEWGCRIRASGYKIYYLPMLTIIHYQGATRGVAMEKGNPSFVWFDSMRSLYGLYHKGQPIVLFDILFSINFLLRGVLYHLWYLRSKDPGMGAKAGLMWQYLRLTAGRAFKNGGPIEQRVR